MSTQALRRHGITQTRLLSHVTPLFLSPSSLREEKWESGPAFIEGSPRAEKNETHVLCESIPSLREEKWESGPAFIEGSPRAEKNETHVLCESIPSQ